MTKPPRLTLHTNTTSGGARDRQSPPDTALRELMVVREIVRAFLTAEHPEEVFRFALERVAPLVGATFASAYLLEPGTDTLRHAASVNWPERYQKWLGQLRVKLGSGPSGRAASERRAIEVPDVLADPSLEDWREVASELGFRAIVAQPLQTAQGVLGAVTFYFADAGGFTTEQRGVLRIVADQIAATAEKAALIDQLRAANSALRVSHTELERQYAAALEARRVKDEFLANISHELRTPLTAVIGYISLMEEELSGPLTREQREDLGNVKEASDRLIRLVDDLLEMTTLRRGGIELLTESFDPRVPLTAALDVCRERPAAVAVRTEIPDSLLPTMFSDRKKIEKILVTLLGNAFKFTSSGEVVVGLEARAGRVRYFVRDTGIGIPADAQQMVFEEFRQVDGSSTRRYGGTGLGLALARRLARLLGGDVHLQSVPDEGSTFIVDLPLEVAEESAAAAMSTARPHDSSPTESPQPTPS